MGIEIERKFLFHFPHFHTSLPTGKHYEQHYIGKKPMTRVRIVDGQRAWLTIKGKGTLTRSEFEWEIPVEDARGLTQAFSQGLVSKTRYKIPYQGHTWEVDQFDGALLGLWLAEIELASAEEPFEKLPGVGLEVTEDPRYTNQSLSTLTLADLG